MADFPLPKRLKVYQHRKRLRGDFCGDWYPSGELYVLKDLDAQDKFGVILHELVEMLITTYFGIPDCCSEGYHHEAHKELNEKAHVIAEDVEKLVFKRLGIDFKSYMGRLRALRLKVYSKDAEVACETCYKKKKCKQKDK